MDERLSQGVLRPALDSPAMILYPGAESSPNSGPKPSTRKGLGEPQPSHQMRPSSSLPAQAQHRSRTGPTSLPAQAQHPSLHRPSTGAAQALHPSLHRPSIAPCTGPAQEPHRPYIPPCTGPAQEPHRPSIAPGPVRPPRKDLRNPLAAKDLGPPT